MVAPCCQPLGQEFGGLAMRQEESAVRHRVSAVVLHAAATGTATAQLQVQPTVGVL
jgi:hypothetical protein